MLEKIRKSKKGQAVIEYLLITVLVGLPLFAVMINFGGHVNTAARDEVQSTLINKDAYLDSQTYYDNH